MQFLGLDAHGSDGRNLSGMTLLFQPDSRPTALRISDLTAQQQTQLQAAFDSQDGAAFAALALSFAPNAPDFQTVLNNAAQAISDGQGRITQITADRTTLAAATTLAAVKPIVDRQLAAEAQIIQDLIYLLRVLRWMV